MTEVSRHTGVTRSSVQRDHALIAPESHVPLHLPGWDNALATVMISPEIGARFSLMRVACEPQACLRPLRPGEELLVLVLAGEADLQLDGATHPLGAEHYAFIPSTSEWEIHTHAAATLLLFSRTYEVMAGVEPPAAVVRNLADVPGEAFLGDPAARLQVLLPDDPGFDWGVNVFTFDPGGTLPQVESHFMEHGLYLLDGEGVYRLGDSWYPVVAGDAIWMSAYLLQWFAATGKQPSRYIYCKEMNRAPLSAR